MLNITNTRGWSQEDIEFISKNYGNMSAKKLSDKLKRTIPAIRSTAMRLKINCKKYVEWTTEEVKLLQEIYPVKQKCEILEYFPKRKWSNIKAKAKSFGIKRKSRNLELINADLNVLLKKENVSAYWLGFLLADGHFSKLDRLVLTLSELDEGHLMKFCNFIRYKEKTCKRIKNKVYVSVMDKNIVRQIKSMYDINNQKTYFPPNLSTFKSMDDDFLISLFIGFVDGDGCIQHRKLAKTKTLTVKCHHSWLDILNYFVSRISDLVGEKIPIGKLDSRGYAKIMISRNLHLCFLKKKTLLLDLPTLKRKWDKIDENFISHTETKKQNTCDIKYLKSIGMNNLEISHKLNLCRTTVWQLLKL